MSTANTEELRLYKNTYLYNGSRYQYLLHGDTQTQAYQTFEQWLGTAPYNKPVYYKSISEPITIREYIDDCDKYTYGSITHHNKTYYFFVDGIFTDSYGVTTINYTIDWWTTNWFSINCTKAHLTRKPTKPDYMQQPHTPYYTNVSQSALSNDYCFMATYIPSTDHGTSYISTLILEGNNMSYNLINSGEWYTVLGLAGADIKDCFAVPLFSYSSILAEASHNTLYTAIGTNASEILGDFVTRYQALLPATSDAYYWIINPNTGDYWTAKYDSTEPIITGIKLNVVAGLINQGTAHHFNQEAYFDEIYTYYFSESRKIRYMKERSSILGASSSTSQTYIPADRPALEITTDLESTFDSNEIKRQGIIDWNGNTIWECPYGRTINKFKVTLLKGLSHVLLQFIPYDSTQAELLTGFAFTYDCRHPGLFVDSYQDYVLKNREYDIAMRRIQSEKQEVQAWVSTAENVGFGYAFGQGSGAVASGIGGVIEAVGTRLINELYDPQIQTQYDLRYQRMTDQISLIGDSITNMQIENQLSKYDLTMDTPSQDAMREDITSNGYVCNEFTSQLSQLFTNQTTPYDSNHVVLPVFQADNVVVEGPCNVIGKQQVVRRLQNGVEFI